MMKAILLEPDHPDAFQGKGKVFGELKLYDEALRPMTGLALKPDLPEAWLGRAISWSG